MLKEEGGGFVRFLRRLLAVAAVVVLALLFWRLGHLMLLLFGGTLLAVALRGGANALCRWTGLPAKAGVLILLLAVITLFVGLFWIVGDQLTSQMRELTTAIPDALNSFGRWLEQFGWGEALLESTREMGGEGVGAGNLFSQISGVATSVLAALSYTLLVLVIMVFMAFEPGLYIRGIVTMFPIPTRPRVHQVLMDTGAALRLWLLGQGISMLGVGIVTTIGLMILGVPLALGLGMLALVLEFIPFIGPFLAAVPGILLAFTVDPTLALWTALFYLVVQQIEGNVLVPIVQRTVVRLPPVLTVAASVAMTVLFGFVGLLFATPLVVALLNMVKMVYVEDVLGDWPDDKDAQSDDARSSDGSKS